MYGNHYGQQQQPPQMYYGGQSTEQQQQYPPRNPNPIYNPNQNVNSYTQQPQYGTYQQPQMQQQPQQQPQTQQYQFQYQQNLNPANPQFQYHQNQYQPNPSMVNNTTFNQNASSNPPFQNPIGQTYNQQHNNTSYTSATPTRPPYIDPETQIVYHCSNPEFEGYLTKQSMWLKDWRRRYFILSGSKLFFAKTPYSAPHGMIDLSTATTVKSADLKSRKKNSFEISTHDFTYLMYADSDKEKDDWIGSVGRAIVRASGTFLKKGVEESGDYGNDNEEDGDYNGGYEDGVFENENNHPYFND
jgi:cytohesin